MVDPIVGDLTGTEVAKGSDIRKRHAIDQSVLIYSDRIVVKINIV